MYVLQHLRKDKQASPGPTMYVSYEPEKDRFEFCTGVDGARKFDAESDANDELRGLPEQYQERFQVVDESEPLPQPTPDEE
jgi:hypothetical protein